MAVGATVLFAGAVFSHNLDTRATGIQFAQDFLQTMSQRAASSQPLVQVGDEFWITIKTTPGPGTSTGVGGYQTFYIPEGYQVLDAAYAQSSTTDPRGFIAIPMKGQSPIAIGAGPVGASVGTGMAGYSYPAPNILGINEAPVTAGGLSRGTLAGVYADTGIFYSTDPRTAFNSYGAASSGGNPSMTNNSGDTVGEWNSVTAPGKLGVMTLWDSHQLRAFGRKDVSPIIDTSDGRGNAPWGMASAVAGPQSGYAWSFDFNAYSNTSGTTAQKVQAGVQVGPWKRVKYPGSQISRDQPGLISSTLGYAGVDASSFGHDFATSGDLPAGTLSGDPERVYAIRFAIGQLEYGRPEYSAIKVRVLAAPSTGCTIMYADAFGGDAGGSDNGKDHLWRYFDPTVVSLTPCTFLQKRAANPLLAPGGTTYFDITFANTGNLTFPNMILRDTLPTGLAFVSATPAASSVSGSNITWNVGTVSPGQMRTVRLYVKATGTGALTNTVTAISGSNMIAKAEEVVEVAARSLLRAVKTVTPSNEAPGAIVQYTITVYNEGTASNGTPLILNDTLPAGFTYTSFVSAKLNGATIASPTITLNATNTARPAFTIGQSIQPGKTLTVTFNATIGATVAAGTYYNQVELNYEGKIIPPIPQAPVTVGGGQIGDTVFRDWNSNGSQDAGEEGIPNVTVQLYNGAGTTLLSTTTTNASGSYLFTGLPAGTYQVRIPSPPGGYTPTFDLDGTGTAHRTDVTLTSNQRNLNADFGYAPAGTGSIGSRVFEDLNNNGISDSGEPGIPNTTVRLLTPNGVQIASTTTSGAGIYAFNNLALGLTYSVVCDLAGPTAYFATDPFSITTSNPRTVTNLAGSVSNIDFGFYRDLPATIGDQVYFDADGSSTYNAGDTPLANIGVRLYASNGTTLLASTTSANNGTYTFTGIIPGTYVVKVDTTDTDIPGNYSAAVSQYLAVTLTSGQTDTTRDFPFIAVPAPLSKSVNLTNASHGANLTYTLTPNYTGSNVLSNVQIIDPIPAGSTFVNPSATPAPTSQPANGGTGNVTWNLGSTTAAANGSQSFSASAPATIELRAASPVGIDNGTALLQIAKPVGLQVGDLMIANFAMRGTDTVDVSGTGWTLIRGAAFETSLKLARATLLYKVANATDVAALNFDFTLAGSGGSHGGCGAIAAFSGVDSTGGFRPNGTLGGPFDVTPNAISVDTGGSANPTASALTTASANAAVIMFAMLQNNPTSSGWSTTSPGALTELYDGGQPGTNRSQVSAAWARKTSPGSTGTGNVTVESTKWGSILLALKPGTTNAYAYDTTTSLASNRSMVRTGDSITVSLTTTVSNATGSPFPITITPPSLAVTGTNGASATFSAAPAAQTLNSNGSVTFTYTSTSVTAGTSPGILTFRATPSDNKGGTWGQATANTVIATPVLSYAVKINSTPAPLSVNNIAQITSTSGIPSGNSNQVTTLVDGSIGDFVWADANGDGFQAGESGIAGVRVFIDLDSDTTYDAGTEPFATTDATGFYRIQGLSAGTYSVRYDYSTVPAGYVPTTPLVHSAVLAATTQYSTADFGLLPPPPLGPAVAEIGDTLWIDSNADGITDPTETVLPDIDVQLYADLNNNGLVDPGDVLLTTQTTDTTGKYLFTGLSAGNYIVDVVESDPQFPSGLLLVSGGTVITSPPTNSVWKVSPTAGQTLLTADFGYKFTGVIGNFLWYDTDGDGLQDETNYSGGPRPVPNGTVVLYADINGNGHVDSGEPIVRTATTADGSPAYPLAPGQFAGEYRFENLSPGDYVVKVSEQEVPSPVNGMTSTMVVTTGESYAITLGTGLGQSMSNTDADFGFIEAAIVEGHVFHDVNGNAVFDPSETPLNNITVRAYRPGVDGIPGTLDDVLAATTTTNVDGEYSFILPPGNYRIAYDTAQIPPALSLPTTTLEYQITAAAGTETTGLDFGVDDNGRIGDTIFADVDSNGAQNPGEPGLSGVTVELWLDANNDNGVDGGDTLLASTTTNASGVYEFTGLADGDYVVRVLTGTLPSGYSTTTTSVPPTESVMGSSIAGATVSGGSSLLDRDFAYPAIVVTHSAIGTIYDDNGSGGGTAGDGSQGGTEPGLAGITVTAYLDTNGDNTPDQIFTTTTDAGGDYLFAGIPQGSDVRIVVSTSTLPSTAYGQTGDPDAVLNHETSITNIIADVTGQDFGYRAVLGSITGTVVDDADGDGLAEPGETAVSGVTISLRYAGVDGILGTSDDVVIGTSTNVSGDYLFTNLLPGLYQITKTNPADFIGQADRDGGNPDVIQVTVLAGNPVTGVGDAKVDQDFEIGTNSIGDYVWYDNDGDGIQDPGERPISGVKVFIDLDSDGVFDVGETFATTNSSGLYTITTLSPGAYTVVVDTTTLPGAATQTGDPDSTLDHKTSVAIAFGDIFTAIDFGYQTPVYFISGQVRDDFDEDGNFSDNDQPVASVLVSLYADSNGNDLFDSGIDQLVGTTTTSSIGNYSFTGLPDGVYFVQETDPVGATSTADTQGGNDNLIPVILAGASSTGNDFLDAVDPSGYAYDVVTGEIVAGGGISVSGPGVVTILLDGSSGQYSFVVDGTPGSYTLTYTPPLGYIIDPARPVAAPSFDPTFGLDPTALGSGENPSNPGYLTNFTAVGNPYYLTFDLEPGDPLVINNNIPLRLQTPRRYIYWKVITPGGGPTPGSNGDGDCYTDLVEYALNLNPSSGVQTAPVFRGVRNTLTGGLDVSFDRVAGGLTDVTFTLTGIHALTDSPAGWTALSITPTVTNNGNGTETVTYADVEGDPYFSGYSQGYVRLRIDLDENLDTTIDATSSTPAFGWTRRTLGTECVMTGHPYLKDKNFCGIVDNVVGSSLNVTTSAGGSSIVAQFVLGRQYYVEIFSGDHAGHRFEIDEASSSATTIALEAASDLNTLTTIPATLAGDKAVIREHHTLNDLFPVTQFFSTGNPATADRLLFYDRVAGTFKTYWLYNNGGSPKWVLNGNATLDDEGARIVEPCEGWFTHPKGVPQEIVWHGMVRANPFACPLSLGPNFIGSGYPMDQSPVMRGMTTAAGFSGSSNPVLADQLLFWKGYSSTQAMAYFNHFLLSAGALQHWTELSNASMLNENNLLLFKPTTGSIYKMRGPLPGYVMPLPWTP